MLDATTFANLIKTNLSGITDAASANTILGNTISSYLLANTVFTFTWTAAMTVTPFTPDPVTVTTGTFTSLTITITPSGATTTANAMDALESQIISGMTSATYNITTTGFTTTPASMGSSSTLNNLDLTPSGETDGTLALQNMCQKIINWVKQLAPIATVPGTHGVYTGTGVVSSIA